MVPAEEHRTPDGIMHFAVDSLTDGDVAIGFRLARLCVQTA